MPHPNPLLSREAIMSAIDDLVNATSEHVAATWDHQAKDSEVADALKAVDHAREVVVDRVNMIVHGLNAGV